MKKHKNKIITAAIILIILTFSFWYGGNAPGLRGWSIKPDAVSENIEEVKEDTYLPAVQYASLTVDDTTVSSTQMLPTPSVSAIDIPQGETEALPREESDYLLQIPQEQPSSFTEEDDFTIEETTLSENPPEEKTTVEEKINDIPIKQSDECATLENKPQNTDETPMTPDEKEALAERIAKENNVTSAFQGDASYSKENGMVINESTGKDKYLTAPVPVGKPIPIEPQDAVITDKELTCTLSVRCDTILKNIAWLDKEKVDLVPKDGIIFAERTVTFYEGESVFNLLLREMKRNKIHMEFENTPIYNSAYIEGINNLYEFDCGELSGWMYKVNDWFPNYGCSRYQLKEGDNVQWVYTCDLGVDVGGYYSAKGE